MKTITVKELNISMEKENINLVDVREEEEYNQIHAINSILKPLSLIHSWESQLDKEKTYYIICRSGGRSSMAIEHLENLGYKNLINVEGGTIAWVEKGFKTN